MSTPSPITNRVQKALYMKSALKQSNIGDDDEKKKDDVTTTGPTIYAEDPSNKTVVSGNIKETPAEYAAKQIKDTEKKTYSYDQLRADTIASGKSEEEADQVVADARSYNVATYDTHTPTAEGKTDNTYNVDKVDAEGNPIMIDDPSGEQVMTKEAGKEFEAKDIPSSYQRMSQYEVGKGHRGRRKALNTEFREQKKLGKWKGKNPTTGKNWTKQEMKADTQVGRQMLEGNYEIAGNFNQGPTGSTHKKTYTNIDDDSYRPRKTITQVKDEALTMRSPLKGLGRILGKTVGKIVKGKKTVQKSASKVVGDVGDYVKAGKKEMNVAYKEAAGIKVDAPPVIKKPLTKAKYKKAGTVKGKGQYGVAGSDKGYNKYKKGFGAPSGKTKVKGTDLPGGKVDKPKGNIFTRNPWKTGAGVAGAIGVGLYASSGGGDTDTTPVPIVPGPKDDDDTTPVTPPKVDPIVPTTTTTTTPTTTGGGDIKVTGVTSGILVDKDKTSNITGPGDALSSSMRRFNERQAKKKARVEGRQERKDLRQSGKARRKANRIAGRALAGKAKSFGVKKHDTNINNMGVVTTPGYKQKDKKKKGSASSWGSTYNV